MSMPRVKRSLETRLRQAPAHAKKAKRYLLVRLCLTQGIVVQKLILTIAEVVKDSVAMLLFHLCVNKETAAAHLRNLLGQQLDTLHRVAEDDALVDVQLAEECG